MVQDRLHKLTCVYSVSVSKVSSKESSKSTRFLGTPLGINRDDVVNPRISCQRAEPTSADK